MQNRKCKNVLAQVYSLLSVEEIARSGNSLTVSSLHSTLLLKAFDDPSENTLAICETHHSNESLQQDIYDREKLNISA